MSPPARNWRRSDAFTFTAQTGVALSSTATSNTITVSGTGTGAAAITSIVGGTYSVNGGGYVSSAGTVNPWRYRHRAADDFGQLRHLVYRHAHDRRRERLVQCHHDSPVVSYTAPSHTGTGPITASFTGGGPGCSFATAQYTPSSAVAAAPPSGVFFPHGLFDFTTNNCGAGATLTVTILYPSPVPGNAKYYKNGLEFGGSPDTALVLLSPSPLPATRSVSPSPITARVTAMRQRASSPTRRIGAVRGGPRRDSHPLRMGDAHSRQLDGARRVREERWAAREPRAAKLTLYSGAFLRSSVTGKRGLCASFLTSIGPARVAHRLEARDARAPRPRARSPGRCRSCARPDARRDTCSRRPSGRSTGRPGRTRAARATPMVGMQRRWAAPTRDSARPPRTRRAVPVERHRHQRGRCRRSRSAWSFKRVAFTCRRSTDEST